MSRKVTYESKMTDKDLVASTLRTLGVTYTEDRNIFRVTSGKWQGLSIDTKSGSVVTDSDYGHDEKVMNELKIAYTETDVRRQYNRTGATIMSREVVTYNGIQGVVLLKCRKAVG